jgi:hypothetical protein
MRILLHFVPQQGAVQRARLGYAFRVFCAIYGHEPVLADERDASADVTVTYGPDGDAQGSVRLTNSEFVRPLHESAPSPVAYSQGDDTTVLFHAPVGGREPDWLAEIFEWLSCADDYSCKRRDAVGRVSFAASYIGRHRLNPRKPYAAVAMAFLQKAIARVKPQVSIGPQCPLASAKHVVINTHDVDFLPTHAMASCFRLAKNALISLSLYRSGGVAAQQTKRAVGVAFGARDPLDQINLLFHQERKRQVTASYYFLCRRGHRRDGNYSLNQASTLIRNLQERGEMEVGVHGSYCCMDQPDGLAAEFDQMRELGLDPIGSRQHWLRFTIPQLLRSIERSGAAYDASLGWPDRSGFRAGACFAFPPYDFEHEAPANFLEIPLALMDRAALVSANHNGNGSDPIAEVLTASRRYGWGGISVLWHPTAFGGGQYPEEVGDVFWKLLDGAREQHESWMSAACFVRNVWPRYQTAGLLPARG